MKMYSLFITCLLVLFQTAIGQPSSLNKKQLRKIVSSLDQYMLNRSEAHLFSGTVFIEQGGQVLLKNAYGWKDASLRKRHTTEGIFQIGSLSKPFTAEAILRLQDLGKLSVRDTLCQYLPNFPNACRITIEQLLTHTSGIPSFDAEEKDTIAWTPVAQSVILDVFKNKALEFSPGSEFRYSNSGYFLLGMVVEKVTGKSFEQAVRELIFQPLEMNKSGFDFIHLQDTARVTGYKVYNQQEKVSVHLIDSTVSFATGSMYSSIGDLYKWALSIREKKVLSPQTWDKAFTRFPTNYKLFKAGYGYGWFIDSLFGRRYIWHSGGITGFTSWLAYFPDDDLFIILLNNFLYEGDDRDRQPLLPVQDLAALVFNKPVDLTINTSTFLVSDSLLKIYSGTYQMSDQPSRKMILAQKGKAFLLTLPGVTSLSVEFYSQTRFRVIGQTVITGKFIFENGKLVKLIISQDGQFEWKKIDP